MSSYPTFLKSLVFSTLIVLSAFTITSCGDDQATIPQAAAAQVNPADLTRENDSRFLIRAVEMKYEQVMLSKLAQQRSSNENIKGFAKMIEDANRAEKSALASLAISKSISVPGIPTKTAQAAYDSLNRASIEDFDFKYVRLVIQGYSDEINHFELATTSKIDPDIQAKAAGMLSDMRLHLMKAKELDAQMNPISELVED
ncbi:MAG: DUF4142 domain-containing protein [Bacteroidota bacterium]|nr:DUF4142 domain-containing protein [Bacteroidota bacterium]